MTEKVLSSAIYDFGDDKIGFTEFDSDDAKVASALVEEDVKLQYTKMLKKIDLTLQMLAQKDLQPDEKIMAMLVELQNQRDVTLKPGGRQVQNFIASGIGFKYNQMHNKIASKKASIEAYLQKSQQNKLQKHLKMNKKPPSTSEFSLEFYAEIDAKVEKMENELKETIKNRLESQMQWLRKAEYILRNEFLRTFDAQAKQALTITDMDYWCRNFNNILNKRLAATTKATRKFNKKSTKRPQKVKLQSNAQNTKNSKKRAMHFGNPMENKRHRRNAKTTK